MGCGISSISDTAQQWVLAVEAMVSIEVVNEPCTLADDRLWLTGATESRAW